MRLPLLLYRRGWGRRLGYTFLLITHEGRKTGKRRQTVAMAATWNPTTREVVVCSAWGETQWVRNLRAQPAREIQIGDQTFVPKQRFLTEDEAATAAVSFRDHHPWRMHLFRTLLGWGDLDTEAAVREFVHARPFISFRPLPPNPPPS